MRCPNCGKDTLTASGRCTNCGKQYRIRSSAPSDAARPQYSGSGRSTGMNSQRPQQNPQRPAQRSGQSGSGAARPSNARAGGTVAQTRTRWNPKFLAACAGILLLLILIPILIAVIAHSGNSLESNRIQLFYSGTAGKTSVVMAGRVFEKSITGKIARTVSSTDGLTQAALTESGELYYITQQKLASVANGVRQFALSADGSRLAYLIESAPEDSDTSSESSTEEETTKARGKLQDEDTTTGTTEYVPVGAQPYLDDTHCSLFLYNGVDATSPLIANHVSAESVSLSPTGAVIAYTVGSDEGTSFEGFYAIDGVKTSIGRNALPIAVSDDATQYYYVKFDNIDDVWVQKLFAKSGENEVKLGEFADGNLLRVYLNRDFSQIIYSLSGKKGSFFLYADDHDKEKLSIGYEPIYAYGLREATSGKAVLTPLESFAKSFFRDSSGSVQYINGKLVCTNTGASGTMCRITPDGKTLYYLDDDSSLNACTVRKLDKRTVAPHVMAFELSADGEVLYYVTAENKLYCVKGGKSKLAAENVYTSKGKGLAVTDAGYLYFLQNYEYGSGTLCYLKGDGNVHVLDSINNVYDIAADVGENIYYRSDFGAISGTYDLYYGHGKKYVKLFEKMG